MAFTLPEDIANRALQHLGIPRVVTLTDNAKSAAEANFAYDKLRPAELRRNLWRFAIRRAVLRPITPDTFRFVPATWSVGTNYVPGSIVFAGDTYWVSVANDNIGNSPGTSTGGFWQEYFGPVTVNPWSAALQYYAGDLAYVAPGDGTYSVYGCVRDTAPIALSPGTAGPYDANTTYFKNEIVISGGTPFQWTVAGPTKLAPGLVAGWTTVITSPITAAGWVSLSPAALSPLVVPWSIGREKNVFALPYRFCRLGPSDKRVASGPFLATSGGVQFTDWEMEGNYLSTSETGPIFMKFGADIADVVQMDALFCEGLAARVAMELCETMTQSGDKMKIAMAAYERFMAEARLINRIELGSSEAAEEDIVSVPTPPSKPPAPAQQ